MTEQKQIEEMAIEMSGCGKSECAPCRLYRLGLCAAYKDASRAISAGYRKQIAGEWVVISKRGLNSKRNRRINYETYTCAACGRSNGKYKANFCPNCGARMKGDEGDG